MDLLTSRPQVSGFAAASQLPPFKDTPRSSDLHSPAFNLSVATNRVGCKAAIAEREGAAQPIIGLADIASIAGDTGMLFQGLPLPPQTADMTAQGNIMHRGKLGRRGVLLHLCMCGNVQEIPLSSDQWFL